MPGERHAASQGGARGWVPVQGGHLSVRASRLSDQAHCKGESVKFVVTRRSILGSLCLENIESELKET